MSDRYEINTVLILRKFPICWKTNVTMKIRFFITFLLRGYPSILDKISAFRFIRLCSNRLDLVGFRLIRNHLVIVFISLNTNSELALISSDAINILGDGSGYSWE